MQIEMKEIFLTTLNVDANIEQILKRKATENTNEQISASVSTELSVRNPDFGFCSVTVKLSTPSGFFSLSATYMGLFAFSDLPKQPSEEEGKQVRAICASRIFPYIRELVADITRREPLGTPVLLATDLMDEAKLLQQQVATATKN